MGVAMEIVQFSTAGSGSVIFAAFAAFADFGVAFGVGFSFAGDFDVAGDLTGLGEALLALAGDLLARGGMWTCKGDEAGEPARERARGCRAYLVCVVHRGAHPPPRTR